MRSLIACIDFSDYALNVAQEAANIAARENATLTLIHAHSNPFETYDWGKFNINLSAQYELYKRALKAKLDELKAQLVSEHAGLDVQTELIFGVDYTGAVVDRINAGEVDLVVMGAKGKSKLAYLLLGSTAEKVLRNTKSSVLTVRIT